MSLDTKESIRHMVGSFLCKPIGRAMCNPIMLATMLTIIIMIIIVTSYDPEHLTRTIFRIFSITVLFMFLNNHILMDDMKCKQLNGDQRDILNLIEKGKDVTGGSLVVPIADREDKDSESNNDKNEGDNDNK